MYFWRLVKYILAAKSNWNILGPMEVRNRDLRDRENTKAGEKPPPRMWEWAPQLIHGGPEQQKCFQLDFVSKQIHVLNVNSMYNVAVFLKQKSSKTSSIV